MLTAPQKAALVIASLGPDNAGPIIERISDKHLRAFTRAYAHLQSIPRTELKAVVEEFVGQLTKEDNDFKGGFDETRELLGQFKTSDEIIRLMDDINVPGGDSIWVKLERADDHQFADYLMKQSPQIIAVVLSKLNTEKASTILNNLDSEIAGDVLVRLSKPMKVNMQALDKLSETIEKEFLAPMRKSAKEHKPGEMIGSMLNNIMSEKRDALLEVISSSAPDIIGDVRKAMLTFQDMSERVPPNAVPLAIKEIELQEFLQAMKFGRENAPESVDFIFKNISQRMAKQYEEEMEELKPIAVKDAEALQAKFMSVIRKLAASGEITLIDLPSDDEEEADE